MRTLFLFTHISAGLCSDNFMMMHGKLKVVNQLALNKKLALENARLQNKNPSWYPEQSDIWANNGNLGENDWEDDHSFKKPERPKPKPKNHLSSSRLEKQNQRKLAKLKRKYSKGWKNRNTESQMKSFQKLEKKPSVQKIEWQHYKKYQDLQELNNAPYHQHSRTAYSPYIEVLDQPGQLLSNVQGTGLVLSSKNPPTNRPKKSLTPLFYNSLTPRKTQNGNLNYNHNYHYNKLNDQRNTDRNYKPLYINNRLVGAYEEILDYDEGGVEGNESDEGNRNTDHYHQTSTSKRTWATTVMPRLVTWIPTMKSTKENRVVHRRWRK